MHPAYRVALLTAHLVSLSTAAFAQSPVRGMVRRALDGAPLAGARITVSDSRMTTYASASGRFVLPLVPLGPHTLLVRAVGFAPQSVPVEIGEAGATVDVRMEATPILLGDIIITAASRTPERVVEAPAAAAPVDPGLARNLSMTAQVPLALGTAPGMDLVQNDIHDFNVNARGFNRALNRRVLVLQDGRDVSIPLLGAQEWSALTMPMEDFSKIEVVRGPGSALYGANAFSGVVSIITPAAREVVGTKLSMTGGGLGTFNSALRHAGVAGQGRFGYRINVGYDRTANWARSRTGPNDLANEYASSVDTSRYPVNTPLPGFELLPLSGQSSAGIGVRATGSPDPETSAYGSARFDYYNTDGSVITAEGGAARVDNQVFVTPTGRLQNDAILRPWSRLAWAADRFFVMAWYTGRHSVKTQHSLSSGAAIEDHSDVFHLEGQFNRLLGGGRVRVVGGASLQNSFFSSDNTLLGADDESRNDWFYSAYGQTEYSLSSEVRLVAAARFDDGDLFGAQLSPKGAIVYAPTPRNSFRLTINRAFQTPSILEYFLRFPAGAPADFSGLEAGLRASPLGPALDSVPPGTLFTNSAVVPIVVRGNPDLDVEHVTGLEFGYKGQLADGIFLTFDAYASRLTNFVTDILPGVNPFFAPWTAPSQVPSDQRAAVEQAVQAILVGAGQQVAAAGLTRVEDGSTAIVFSIGNAGRVNEYGFEVGAGIQILPSLHLDANYSYFDSHLDKPSLAPGQVLLPNTPTHRINALLGFDPTMRISFRGAVRWVDGYDWASGIFAGRIPPSLSIDLTGGYEVTDFLRLQAAATNLLDQRRYHVYGGSVIGRRLLVGFTALH